MNLLFRTDASIAIGTGHVMRCLALAQASQDAGGRAVFAMAESTASIDDRLRSETFEVLPVPSVPGAREDANETIAIAQAQQAEWIVVDGYQFDAEYQRALKAAGFRILFLDDYGHASHYFADVVLNQNVHANEGMFGAREPYTRLLLGTRYCVLRREFAAWRGWKREIAPVGRKVLVMMGGSDPENLTGRVIEALRQFADFEVTVVVGGSNPHFTGLQTSASRSGQKITVQRDVSNMAELMAAADMAISAAGSTCWELCLLGLPSLLLDVAPNQTTLAKELDRTGCAIHVGNQTVSAENIAVASEKLLRSHELRQSLSRRCRELVDGNGTGRVVSVLRTHPLGVEGFRLRPAQLDDSRSLWEWANDPAVRAASFSSALIPWESHVAWFAEKLGQGRSLILIAEDDSLTPCGQIRFDVRADGGWEVDVTVAATMRGQGLASRLIRLGIQGLRKEHPDARVHAFVKPVNEASLKAFEKAGFTRIAAEQIRGNAAIHLVCGGTEPDSKI